ncbi:MAG: D-2-hydroxyacid dehydrogenase [Bacteroidales bacterium]
MKIVVLDGYTLNPGDLSWDDFKEYGDIVLYDRTPEDKIIERAGMAEIVLTNKTPLSSETLKHLPHLKYIGVLATGYNIVDIESANNQGVVVTNIPAYGTASVSQMTFALLLELCHHVQRHSDAVMTGKWSASSDWCFWDYPLVELQDKTIGIIGFGNIGHKTADIATAFGMNVMAHDRNESDQSHRKNFNWTRLPELFREADVISLHCPLTPETKGIINKANLALMKRTSFLINTARGPLIVEEDLAEALNNDIIAGAGLDVLSLEPPALNNPLFQAKNCIITPHISWATREARRRLMKIATGNLRRYLNGNPVNLVR